MCLSFHKSGPRDPQLVLCDEAILAISCFGLLSSFKYYVMVFICEAQLAAKNIIVGGGGSDLTEQVKQIGCIR
mgnify:CR=1 FL=1